MNNNLVITILAAGEGKRMRTDLPKVLHHYKEKPMLVRIVESVRELNPNKIVIITGKYHTVIIQTLSKYIDIFGLIFVRQQEPLGTGHAIKCCLDEFVSEDKILILNGDMPLITSDILHHFIKKSNGSCNILVARFSNPHGYGRIIYDKDGDFMGIIEEKDCTDQERKVDIINTGIYYITGHILREFIPLISNNNVQKEYYLTDIVKIVKSNTWDVIDTILLDEINNKYVSGVNTPEELEKLEELEGLTI
jgi:UDP-N-acetylglucosamine diphosphorylase/glucosamine-1-phosphate N-acetyltransferase